MPSHPISLRSICNIVHPPTSWSSQWSFPSWFPTNILYGFFFSPIRATCHTHLILLDLIILIILGEKYKFMSNNNTVTNSLTQYLTAAKSSPVSNHKLWWWDFY
jgi:hypothetical protein